MALALTNEIARIAAVDLFKRSRTGEIETGIFVARPFYLDYDRAHLLVADAWKQKAKGIPQGAFLLAYYENEDGVAEALLLRALRPTKLPTDSDIICSMIEYYKDNLRTAGKASQLDSFTRYEFSFSGLDCRILGTFYKDGHAKTHFGADVENFYSAHNYSVVKPNPVVLEAIVNFREGEVAGNPTDIRLGKVRYSSARRFQAQDGDVPVFVSPKDFLGKRTALFGMTRTGKSNTVKKIIQASVVMSGKAPYALNQPVTESVEARLEPFSPDGLPKYPVGQIIFDINGEYANANLQDEGTAIFELYRDQVTRYSVLEKSDFKVIKVNFYRDIQSGFELIRSHLSLENVDYVQCFINADLSEPENKKDPDEPEDNSEYGAMIRHERRKAAYLCCLYRAGFKASAGVIKFRGEQEINAMVWPDGRLDPVKGLTLEQACDWFTAVWEQYDDDFFVNYKRQKGHEWADEDLKALLVMLTRKAKPGGKATLSGFKKLMPLVRLHTNTVGKPFEVEVVEELRKGRIVIVDLSQGDPEIQRLYSERICRQIFADAMDRFIGNKPTNFVQFYFEEAHNLFPRKDDKDLSQVYNRIAKEGAKLNLGLIYATQEVSSISGNILKNTQNWFIAHLNNEDETKYYDFGDFTDALVRFSASDDKGFVRMKTYSNPFVVPVQIDRFSKDAEGR
jgi:DNA helicase HerA-like ATPase